MNKDIKHPIDPSTRKFEPMTENKEVYISDTIKPMKNFAIDPIADPLNVPMVDPLNVPMVDPMNVPMVDPMNVPMVDPMIKETPEPKEKTHKKVEEFVQVTHEIKDEVDDGAAVVTENKETPKEIKKTWEKPIPIQ